MNTQLDNAIIGDVRIVYTQQRNLAEAALAQVDDDAFFRQPAPRANSLAVIVKHVGGNLRSRWTDFLKSDGEKPDRNRDGEFVVETDTRNSIMKTWESGWAALENALSTLSAADLARSVTIRGVPYRASHAVLLNLAHTAHHSGQIVQLAKQLAADRWQTLSIPRPGENAAPRNLWK